jgi:hypothetical protein
VLKSQEKWLAATSWEAVVAINQELCKGDKNSPHRPGKGADSVKKQWEINMARGMTFREMVDFFRQCHDQAPFAFFNGNTFAQVLREVMKRLAGSLPTHEAKMLESSVTHYVAGSIKTAELDAMCSHADKYFKGK